MYERGVGGEIDNEMSRGATGEHFHIISRRPQWKLPRTHTRTKINSNKDKDTATQTHTDTVLRIQLISTNINTQIRHIHRLSQKLIYTDIHLKVKCM